MERGGTAVLKLDDPIVSKFHVPEGVEVAWFQPSSNPSGWGLEAGQLTRNGRAILAADELRVPGLHNVSNALSALAAGHALGLDPSGMLAGLRGFGGLPHRLEHVRHRRGIDWFDDSKATNPHAAAAGLKAIETKLIVITGGYEKGLDLRPFIDALQSPRQVICTGPTTSRTIEAIRGRWPVTRATGMADAVAQAAQIARYGDAVILSPAASSFDAYRSYAHRGDVFQEAVRSLPE
jgi:UDP-N-acetylmuramoylalanine--D-glutamate ligase